MLLVETRAQVLYDVRVRHVMLSTRPEWKNGKKKEKTKKEEKIREKTGRGEGRSTLVRTAGESIFPRSLPMGKIAALSILTIFLNARK